MTALERPPTAAPAAATPPPTPRPAPAGSPTPSRAPAPTVASALIPYIVAGYPDAETSLAIALAAIDAGADLLEVGLPYSDPLADGTTLQRASAAALAAGATLERSLDLVRRIAARAARRPARDDGLREPADRRRRRPGAGRRARRCRRVRHDRGRPDARRGRPLRGGRRRGRPRRRLPRRPHDVAGPPRRRRRPDRRLPLLRLARRDHRRPDQPPARGRPLRPRGEGGQPGPGRRRLRRLAGRPTSGPSSGPAPTASSSPRPSSTRSARTAATSPRSAASSRRFAARRAGRQGSGGPRGGPRGLAGARPRISAPWAGTDWAALVARARRGRARCRDDGSVADPRAEAGTDPWASRARDYDERVARRWTHPDSTRAFILAEIGEGATVLDIGAGTGAWAAFLAPRAASVTAVERSPAMIARLRANLAARGVDNVRIVHGGWPDVAVEPHDYALCAHAVYWYPDLPAFVRRMSDATRSTCFLVLRDPRLDGIMAEAARHIRGHPMDSPNVTVAHNVLLQMGIRPHLVDRAGGDARAPPQREPRRRPEATEAALRPLRHRRARRLPAGAPPSPARPPGRPLRLAPRRRVGAPLVERRLTRSRPGRPSLPGGLGRRWPNTAATWGRVR